MKVQQQKDSVQARTAPRRLSGAQDLRKPALRTEGRSLPPCAQKGAASHPAQPLERTLKRPALEKPAEMDFCRPQESSRRSAEQRSHALRSSAELRRVQLQGGRLQGCGGAACTSVTCCYLGTGHVPEIHANTPSTPEALALLSLR